MAATFRNRQVPINLIIFDQVNIFQSDNYNKVTGLLASNVDFQLMLNNQVVSWPLLSGTSIQDSQVVAGSVYWDELPGSSYGIRFFPNSIGHWNLTVSYASIPQIISIDYDVTRQVSSTSNPFIKASFC